MNVDNEMATFYLEKYARMLSKFSKNICDRCPNVEYDDIHQILSIKLISIIPMYKKGACKESSYFYKIFERETKSIIRSYYSSKNQTFNKAIEQKSINFDIGNSKEVDIENVLLSDGQENYLNPDDYLNEINLIEIIDEFISGLEGIDKKIFLLHFKGMQVKEISRKLKMDRKNIYRRLTNLKKKLAERIKLID